jgi:hypothetical protein
LIFPRSKPTETFQRMSDGLGGICTLGSNPFILGTLHAVVIDINLKITFSCNGYPTGDPH